MSTQPGRNRSGHQQQTPSGNAKAATDSFKPEEVALAVDLAHERYQNAITAYGENALVTQRRREIWRRLRNRTSH